MKKFFSSLSAIALVVGIGGFAPVAFAATGSLSCTNSGSSILCTGSSWSATTAVEINPNTADSCSDAVTYQFSCTTDGSGNLPSGCRSANLPFTTYYAYGSEDNCATSTAASTNPQALSGKTDLADSTTSIGTAFADIRAFVVTHTVSLATALAVVGAVVTLLSLALRKLGIRRKVRKM